jgi:hypothetical protein
MKMGVGEKKLENLKTRDYLGSLFLNVRIILSPVRGTSDENKGSRSVDWIY